MTAVAAGSLSRRAAFIRAAKAVPILRQSSAIRLGPRRPKRWNVVEVLGGRLPTIVASGQA